jgi:hypothetical protein
MKKPGAIDARTVVQIRPGVLYSRLEEEIVALDLEKGKYFGLNEVGGRVWTLLQTPRALGAVQEALLQEYEVPAEQLWRDLETLIADLLRHDLAEVRP